MMFCPMKATWIAVILAGVVCSPIGRFARVTILAELGAGKEGVERVGRMNWRTVEHEHLWDERWRRRFDHWRHRW